MGEPTEKEERRRNPRYNCGGRAKIVRLPSDGILRPGRIHDLSLGGCCLETTSPLECGVMAEVLLRVNTSCFRAIGQVRGLRDGMRICMEFHRLSSRGRDMLAELIEQLAALQSTIDKMKSSGRTDPELIRRFFQNRIRARLRSERLPISGEGESTSLMLARRVLVVDDEDGPIPVDLFI